MDNWCEGCRFHDFPYKAKPPIKIDGKYSFKNFTCKEDVYDVVEMLSKEIKDHNKNKGGKGLDIAMALSKQLPHFCCPNLFYDLRHQKDIEKYLYCKEFGVSPYEGSYNNQPKKWISKSFFIKKAFAKKEQALIEANNKEVENG